MKAAHTTDQLNTNLPGFILTRQQREKNGKLELVYWAATDQGPVRIAVHGQECVCFLAGNDFDKAKRLLARKSGWRHADSSLRDFKRQQVIVLYFASQRLLYEARDLLATRDIVVYEADVRAVDRYLMERFITGGLEMPGQTVSRQGYLETDNPHLRPLDYRPSLSCVSLDIETQFKGDPRLYSIGVYADDRQAVFMVDDQAGTATSNRKTGSSDSCKTGDTTTTTTNTTTTNTTTTTTNTNTTNTNTNTNTNTTTNNTNTREFLRLYPDERTLLLAFLEWLASYDPDVLIGWNVVNFDLRFLQETCDRLRLSFDLGRRGEKVSWRQARDNANRYFALVPGRVVLDGIELMRTATYNFENFSLDHVAQKLLARGKLVDDVDQRGEEITRLFETDKQALASYNLEDCKLVWDIFAKEQLIEFAIERSQLTGLEMNRYGGSVAAFDYLYLPGLHRSGYVAPALGQNKVANLSPGGYVMDSIPGFYQHVIVLDFKSLYPSIIRTFHVDPLALVEGQIEEDPIEGFDGGVFSRTTYLLPELIENLWRARDRAKSTGNKVLSQAIKIIMNSFYGVLGTTGCRFFDPRLVSSITRRGHQIIKESKDFIEQRGYQVIYGDTDSVFVLTGAVSAESVDRIGRDLADRLNNWWIERLTREMKIESCLEIEFETHFHKFLMPTVRGAETGSKKRYAGLVRTGPAETDYELIFKGLEAVRSDWSPLARRFQKELYERIFLDRPFENFVLQTIEALEQGESDQDLVLRRRLRRKLGDYVKNVPPHVQAARKEVRIREERGLPPLYDQGGWIEYLMTVNGPEPRRFLQSPIDYEFYIERQISPIADSILVFKSTSMKELLDKQIELF